MGPLWPAKKITVPMAIAFTTLTYAIDAYTRYATQHEPFIAHTSAIDAYTHYAIHSTPCAIHVLHCTHLRQTHTRPPLPIRMVRVLYCHGLESGPHGYKVEAMRAWAETVTCADQEMSLINPLKRHSIVRSLAAVLFDEGPSGWLPAAFQRSLEKCAQLQREALSSCGRVDVLVGSSWGGAVALKLLADGGYAGPSVLLCAHPYVHPCTRGAG